MNKKLIFITTLGLYIPLTLLTSEKSNQQTTRKYSLGDFNSEQDTQQILEIFSKDREWLSSNYSPPSYHNYLLGCQKPSCNIKVLRENEEVAGYIMYKKNWFKQGSITQLAVSDKFRNKGYGKLLVSTAMEELNGMNLYSTNIICHPDNTAALDFYKKMGFVKRYTTSDFVLLRYNFTVAHTDVSEQPPTDIFQQPWDL